MAAKYRSLIADYERRIEKAFTDGDVTEAIHLLERLRELRNMPDFPPSVWPRLREVLARFDVLVVAERTDRSAKSEPGRPPSAQLDTD